LNFIYSFLQVKPERRMSITECLTHPWLLSHVPFHPPDFEEFQRTYYDESRMNVSHVGVSHVGFSGDLWADDPSEPGGHHGGSPTSTLRRRKDVIAQADEGRVLLPEPSTEMVANIVRQGPATPQKKRALSVLPEDSLEHVYAEAAARSAAAATAAAAAAAIQSANVHSPLDDGSDSLEISDARRRSGRRTKVPRRGWKTGSSINLGISIYLHI
jgi:hypothetical protein